MGYVQNPKPKPFLSFSHDNSKQGLGEASVAHSARHPLGFPTATVPVKLLAARGTIFIDPLPTDPCAGHDACFEITQQAGCVVPAVLHAFRKPLLLHFPASCLDESAEKTRRLQVG